MDIDILTTGMQKYGLGIPGIAFLYVKENIASHLIPKITGWFGQKNPFAFDIRGQDYAVAAKIFDSGTFPIINGFAARAALEVLESLDLFKVDEYLGTLSEFTKEELAKAELSNYSLFPPEEKGSTTAVHVEDASRVEAELAKKGIIVSARNDVIRIAPHYYNTKEDIAEAIAELGKIVKNEVMKT